MRSQGKRGARAGARGGRALQAGTLGILRELQRQEHPLHVIPREPTILQEPKNDSQTCFVCYTAFRL